MRSVHLDLNPNSPTAVKEWWHCHRKFSNFIQDCGNKASSQLRALVNCVIHNVWVHWRMYPFRFCHFHFGNVICKDTILNICQTLSCNLSADVRWIITQVLKELCKLGKDYNLKVFTAEKYWDELIRDVFINGLISPMIYQHLKNKTLVLQAAYDQAYSLVLAHCNVSSYLYDSSVWTHSCCGDSWSYIDAKEQILWSTCLRVER